MVKVGVFHSIGGFLSAGGHITVGIGLGLGWGKGALTSYIERHWLGVDEAGKKYVFDIAERGTLAARHANSLPSYEFLNPSLIPEVPEQYGDDPAGRRVHYALELAATDEERARLVRLDAPDFYTRDDMADILAIIMRQWKIDSPEAFGGDKEQHIEAQAIREIYTSRKF